MLKALRGDGVELYTGDHWVMELLVTDDNGAPVEQLPGFAGEDIPESPDIENLGLGRYRLAIKVMEPGWDVVIASTDDYGVCTFRAYVTNLDNPLGNMPILDDVTDYLGDTSASTEEIQNALDAETEAQRMVTSSPARYPRDLREALLRRVAVNLAKRGIPLAVLQGDAETGSLTIPGRDPEVRRLEAPYRKVVIV